PECICRAKNASHIMHTSDVIQHGNNGKFSRCTEFFGSEPAQFLHTQFSHSCKVTCNPKINTLPYNYKRIIANFANVHFRRQISVWSLLIIMFVQTFGLSLLYGLYYTDKPVFIELFCVNQDKPEMHGNGSCRLSTMDKHQEQD